MGSDFLIDKFGDRTIILKGVGKMFYQDGFPIEIAMQAAKDEGIEVSLLHVADELLKHGWNGKTVIAKLSNELGEQKENIITFCNSSYEEQREMLYQYLFGSQDKKESLKTLFNRIKKPK